MTKIDMLILLFYVTVTVTIRLMICNFYLAENPQWT